VSETQLPRHTLYSWLVTGHSRFGAWVEGRGPAAGVSGLIDIASMDLPAGEGPTWLPIGAVVQGVVSFYTRGGQLHVSIRPVDVDAARQPE
jgi:hypothetical protein